MGCIICVKAQSTELEIHNSKYLRVMHEMHGNYIATTSVLLMYAILIKEIWF